MHNCPGFYDSYDRFLDPLHVDGSLSISSSYRKTFGHGADRQHICPLALMQAFLCAAFTPGGLARLGSVEELGLLL